MPKQKQYTLKELKKKLTEKQKTFCHEYIIDWNGARAYRSTYKNVTDKTARVNSSRLLTNANIQQYIDNIKEDIAKEAGISKLSIILEQKKIAFSSIAHLHETWIKRVEFEQLEDYQKDCIQEIETKIRTEYQYDQESEQKEPISVEFVKIKLYDKQKALDSITKMMGWNEAEKIDHSSKDGSMSTKKETDLSKLTDKELLEYKKLQSKIESE